MPSTSESAFDYRDPELELDEMPAYMAVMLLATRIADELGDGHVDDDGETDGRLECPAVVSETGVLGAHQAVTTMDRDGVATVHVSDDIGALDQLRGLLDELSVHCVGRWAK